MSSTKLKKPNEEFTSIDIDEIQTIKPQVSNNVLVLDEKQESLESLHEKVAGVTEVFREYVKQVYNRGNQLETLERKSEFLTQKSKEFEPISRKTLKGLSDTFYVKRKTILISGMLLVAVIFIALLVKY